MPVVKVKGGFRIKGHYNGQPKLIGTNGGQPFTSKAAAERVSGIRESYRTPYKKWK
jgi:hypothetical protein